MGEVRAGAIDAATSSTLRRPVTSRRGWQCRASVIGRMAAVTGSTTAARSSPSASKVPSCSHNTLAQLNPSPMHRAAAAAGPRGPCATSTPSSPTANAAAEASTS
jgi:hypothetical protein